MVDMKKLRALAAEKQEQLSSGSGEEYPPWLDLAVEEEFVGKITKVRANSFDDTGKTHIYEVSKIDDDDDIYTLRAQKALLSKIEKQNPEVGSVIYIKYLGKVKSTKSNFKFNDYEVAILTDEEYEELTGKPAPKKPDAKKPDKKPSKPAKEEDDDDDDEPKKPAKGASKSKPKADEDELSEEDAEIKKYVDRALEFNDNEVDIDELMRLCKTKKIVFKDAKAAKAKFTELGFTVGDDGLVSKE
jgi:hypothetical protein